MRGSGRAGIAGLVLILCAAAGSAFAIGKEPVTGGLLNLPGDQGSPLKIAPPNESPVPAATPPASPQASPPSQPIAPTPVTVVPVPAPAVVVAETGKADDTSWGLLIRGGYFGLPNFIADELFYQHPKIAGYNLGAEIRYHGESGGRGVSSIGLAFETATARTDGDWRKNESDVPKSAQGEISMLAFTLTGYWSLFPSWYVHPYFGIGIGVAHVKGFYKDESERIDADVWIPAVHVPVGVAVELGKRFQLTAEGRFINGIAIGGALQVRF